MSRAIDADCSPLAREEKLEKSLVDAPMRIDALASPAGSATS